MDFISNIGKSEVEKYNIEIINMGSLLKLKIKLGKTLNRWMWNECLSVYNAISINEESINLRKAVWLRSTDVIP